MFLFDSERAKKRTLGERDKKILYQNAKGKCENPACKKKITYDEMVAGHKTAWSKNGSTTLSNSVCLRWRCNNLQGNDSWAVFLKKQNIKDPKAETKNDLKKALEALTVTQLKSIASKHKIRVTGEKVEGFIESHRKAPTKRQYITKLTGAVTLKEVSTAAATPKKAAATAKKPVKAKAANK